MPGFFHVPDRLYPNFDTHTDIRPQRLGIRATGCAIIYVEYVSGACARPALNPASDGQPVGKTLLVIHLDTLGHLLNHLLQAIETLEAEDKRFGREAILSIPL